MQTFLPYECFEKSAKVLDYKRLGKQRVEAFQLLNALAGKTKGWVSHPATKMWRGYEDALCLYHNVMIQEWINRGYNNSMKFKPVTDSVLLPWWLGWEELHASHRGRLLAKDPEFYSQYGWTEDPTKPYIWPEPREEGSDTDHGVVTIQEHSEKLRR